MLLKNNDTLVQKSVSSAESKGIISKKIKDYA